ncbi:hypothetical protein [Larkinella knui]|uniref:Uncharacterized protein n=1 Tax=Larkinella knui TaxID=2025310 RepID=A0A3P1CJP4_9BACT|nr:hypothetical protein [Larkinella knui]RRB13563.1 hypothetical protein EHT87_14970 [Larkinella knui]
MKRLYLCFLLTAVACQPSKNDEKDQPNAYRDLLIDRMIWKKSEVANPQEKPTNRHWFTLTNTSETYLYRQIEVRFDYFDSKYHKISSSKTTIDKALGPREALSLGEIEDGPVNPTAHSATVTVVKAKSERAKPD